jgi:hypothetical protein
VHASGHGERNWVVTIFVASTSCIASSLVMALPSSCSLALAMGVSSSITTSRLIFFSSPSSSSRFEDVRALPRRIRSITTVGRRPGGIEKALPPASSSLNKTKKLFFQERVYENMRQPRRAGVVTAVLVEVLPNDAAAGDSSATSEANTRDPNEVTRQAPTALLRIAEVDEGDAERRAGLRATQATEYNAEVLSQRYGRQPLKE